MILGKLWNSVRAAFLPGAATRIITIDNAAKFIEDPERCLNDKDGSEFAAGIRAAFMPLHDFVTKVAQKDLGYGDVLRHFAQINHSHLESAIVTLLDLANAMQQPRE